MHGPIGFYVTCDDAECSNCFDEDSWEGFEDWEEPIPIFQDTESDTPTHCSKCEALIPHALTGEGYEYVREAFFHVGRGRKCIVKTWIEEYIPSLASRVSAWPDRDQYSPQEV